MKGYFMLILKRIMSVLIRTISVIAVITSCILTGTIQASAEIITMFTENGNEYSPVSYESECSYVKEVRWITNCEYNMSDLMFDYIEQNKPFSICKTSMGRGADNLAFAFRENGKQVAYVFPSRSGILKCIKLSRANKRK